MNSPSEIVEFLRARLDEDARVAGQGAETWEDRLQDEAGRPAALVIARGHYIAWDLPDEMAIHIARHDPARVLAEVEAKRRLLDGLHPSLLDGESTLAVAWGTDPDYSGTLLKLLALPYADHPDYRDEWRP